MDSIDTKVALTVRHLQHQVNTLQLLQRHLNSIIDPALAQFIQVSNIKKQTLILIADNSSIATHVKLIAPAIVEGMTVRAVQFTITAVKCKVKKPVEEGVTPYQNKSARLSTTAAKQIAQTASGIKNERLRSALEKLSATLHK